MLFCLHTAGVAGSNPAAPTNQINQLGTTTPLDWVLKRLFVTALSHSFANERSVAMAFPETDVKEAIATLRSFANECDKL